MKISMASIGTFEMKLINVTDLAQTSSLAGFRDPIDGREGAM